MSLLAQTSTQQLVTSSITAVTAQFQTLSTQTFNVSSINGIVPGAAFNGSTLALSTGSVYASNVMMSGPLNMNTNVISNAGTITESTYVSNMVLWFDGNDSTTLFQDGGGTTPVTADNQSVYLWKDKSVYATNATVVTTSYSAIPKSTYGSQNSKNGIYFGGTSGFQFSSANMPGGTTSNATYFFVAKQSSSSPPGQSFAYPTTTVLFTTGNRTQSAALQTTQNNGGMQVYTDNISPDGGSNWTNSVPYIQTLVVQSGQIIRRANGLQLSLTTITGVVAANTGTGRISETFGSFYNYWNGQVYEVLVYNTPLLTIAMQEIEGYLAWKWGITLNVAHPYYAASPGIIPNPSGTLTQFGSFGLDTANNIQISATNAIRLTGAVQIPTTLTTSSFTVSSINGAAPWQPSFFTSTVQGLGTTGYISTAQLNSTVSGLTIVAANAFTGSTTTLSAGTINVSTLNMGYLSSVQGYVSSLRTDSLTVGGPTGYVTVQDLTTATISTGQLVAGAGFISSLQINTLSFGPTGYVIVGDVIANSLSTTRLNTQALYTNNAYIGNVSSQSAILFPGIDGTYRGTAVAERTTGVGTQELLLYKVSSTTDQIRLQTTGNIVFEAGAAARSWPSTAALATPTLYIQGSTSNVGVGTASPATTLDVAGTGRFQLISSYALNVSSINGIVPGGAFNGSTIALSTARILTSSLTANQITTTNLIVNNGTETINFNGGVGVSAYGTGVDTLSLKSPISAYGGGIASLFFGNATAAYPLARIVAVDSVTSAPGASALLFQTATAAGNAGLSGVTIFSYTGADQTYTVPSGVTSVTISMWSGGGGGGQTGTPGADGYWINGALTVSAGQIYRVVVAQGGVYNSTATTYGGGGGAGSGGGGGSGGGRSALQLQLTAIITSAVASGTTITYTTSSPHGLVNGYGVSVTNINATYNQSGIITYVSSTQFSIVNSASAGNISSISGTIYLEVVDVGGGGGSYQGSGDGPAGGGGLTTGGNGLAPYNGQGGTQTAGGAPGTYSSPNGSYGAFLTGGASASGRNGGGGGGGWFGGGGGDNYGGGGGGSSYTSYPSFALAQSGFPGNTDLYYISGLGAAGGTGTNGGNGRVVIVGAPSYVMGEAMRISQFGYLGVGTAAPSTLLDVAGTARAQTVSTLALQTSSINGQTFGGPITSTMIGLGTVGYISTSQLTSTVQGLASNISSMIDPTELTSTVTGLGTVGFISTVGLTYAVASTAQGLGTFGYTSTNQLLSTTIGVYGAIGSNITTTVQPQFASTVQGLGTAGYISSTQLGSTVTNLITRIGAGGSGTTFVGSTTFLSATQILFSTQTGYNISSVLGFVSSLQVDELQIGTGFGIIALGDTNMSSISTIGIVAGLGNFTTINVSSINGAIPGTGSGGTTFTGTLGTVSSLTALRFFGLTGTYANTAVAEVSTGTGLQELLLYKVSSVSDQVRVQTTGNVIFETGVGARSWPTASRVLPPTLYIAGSNSNVGIGTSNPVTALDVAGTGRFQTLSSLNITAGSINYSVAFV